MGLSLCWPTWPGPRYVLPEQQPTSATQLHALHLVTLLVVRGSDLSMCWPAQETVEVEQFDIPDTVRRCPFPEVFDFVVDRMGEFAAKTCRCHLLAATPHHWCACAAA